jgi:16S rRNA (guanine527-N7)-methyltransferase
MENELLETLGDAQRLGFLGAAPLPEILAHARRFVAALPPDSRRIVDLGSGGGVPGLVIALDVPDAEVWLMDRRATRMDAVRRWVLRLGWAHRVHVVAGEASLLARDTEYRGRADAVVARGLGAPGVTAELARGFVRPGGVLVVSEPPGPPVVDRWPTAGLSGLGWTVDATTFPGVIRLRAEGEAGADVPRRRVSPPRF